MREQNDNPCHAPVHWGVAPSAEIIAQCLVERGVSQTCYTDDDEAQQHS